MSTNKIFFPYHRVKKGETLRSISSKYNLDPTTLLLKNNLSPKEIKENVILKIVDD